MCLYCRLSIRKLEHITDVLRQCCARQVGRQSEARQNGMPTNRSAWETTDLLIFWNIESNRPNNTFENANEHISMYIDRGIKLVVESKLIAGLTLKRTLLFVSGC